ncbi:MAG: CDP-glycerol glycerophosphotransferase family protein [Candidatus Fimisoma sp.]
MKRWAIRCFKTLMSFLYFFFKLLPVKAKVTLMSRQSDDISLDFRLLEREFEKNGICTVVLSKKMGGGIADYIGYFFHMLRQMYHIATSEVVIVDSYCILVSILHHRKNLKVVQIWHALSAIKQFGCQTIGKKDGANALIAQEMRMHRNYDYVLCSSDITAKFFCEAFDVKGESIVKLGLPRIDYILNISARKDSVLEIYPHLKEKKNILYVPTFRKGRPVNLKPIIDKVDTEKYNLIIKLHPLDTISKSEAPAGKDVIFDEKLNTYDLLSIADIIISDYSSFVIEASLVGKPIYLYLYDYDEYESATGVNLEYAKEKIGKYVFKSAEELFESIERPYDLSVVEDLKNRYIDVDTTNCSSRIVDFVKQFLNHEN